jgi:hypothetical protein
MKKTEAEKITHTLSKPGKMPGYAYSTPAAECKTGSKLRKVPGSVCANCYAYKRGRYKFENVVAAQYKRLNSISKPLWATAMAAQINLKLKSGHGFFRWHDSGDVQDLKHLAKIFKVCRLTPGVKHWMPTREAWIKNYLDRAPKNLVIRFSGQMVDQPAVKSWPHTSTVVSNSKLATCPAPKQGNSCKDCRQCWDPSVSNVAYGEH